MTTRARGTFDVKLVPQPDADTSLGRLTIEKQFQGDLEGTSKGQMLAIQTTMGSAGYVAMETVTGTIGGKSGTFALQHGGTMNRGVGTLTVTVVPDSGTGELEGISGSLAIIIADGQHRYEFDYMLPVGA